MTWQDMVMRMVIVRAHVWKCLIATGAMQPAWRDTWSENERRLGISMEWLT